MSVEEKIRQLMEQAEQMTASEESLTEEDLELLSDEELNALVENIDQLDELSKSTLGSYIKKASTDRVNKTKLDAELNDKVSKLSDVRHGIGDKDARASVDNARMRVLKQIDANDEKHAKRKMGIVKAVNRLTKEDLDVMSQEDFDALIEDYDNLDEDSQLVLANFVAQLEEEAKSRDIENAATLTAKVKAKAGNQDPDENGKVAKTPAKAPEGKEYNIKKEPSFKEGDQSEVFEAIDLGSLFDGEDLTEEFKTKAATIFESAVAARVEQELAVMQKELAEQAEQELAELKEGLVEQVDGYLGYISEQWLQKNEIALERGIKADLFESLMSSMYQVFTEHYINVPEEQLDVLEDMVEANESLEEALNEATQRNVELTSTLKEISKQMSIEEAVEDLSDVQAEKFRALVESIAFEDEETFAEKLSIIKENYFSVTQETKQPKVDFVSDEPVQSLTEEVEVKLDPTMALYTQALNK